MTYTESDLKHLAQALFGLHPDHEPLPFMTDITQRVFSHDDDDAYRARCELQKLLVRQ